MDQIDCGLRPHLESNLGSSVSVPPGGQSGQPREAIARRGPLRSQLRCKAPPGTGLLGLAGMVSVGAKLMEGQQMAHTSAHFLVQVDRIAKQKPLVAPKVADDASLHTGR